MLMKVLLILAAIACASAEVTVDSMQGTWYMKSESCHHSLEITGTTYSYRDSCLSGTEYQGSVGFGAFLLSPTFEAQGDGEEKITANMLYIGAYSYNYAKDEGTFEENMLIVFGDKNALGFYNLDDDSTSIYTKETQHPVLHGVLNCTLKDKDGKDEGYGYLIAEYPNYMIYDKDGKPQNGGLVVGEGNSLSAYPTNPKGKSGDLTVAKTSDSITLTDQDGGKLDCPDSRAMKATDVDGNWVSYGDNCVSQFKLFRGYMSYAEGGEKCDGFKIIGFFEYDSDKKKISVGYYGDDDKVSEVELTDVAVTKGVSMSFKSDGETSNFKIYSAKNAPYVVIVRFKGVKEATTAAQVRKAIVTKAPKLKEGDIQVTFTKAKTRSGTKDASAAISGEKTDVDAFAKDPKITIEGTAVTGEQGSGSKDLSKVSADTKTTSAKAPAPSIAASLTVFFALRFVF